MEADALHPEPLHPDDGQPIFETKKSGALWTEEPVTSDEDQPADVRAAPPSPWEWWWELLSMAFSIACMIGIVVVLLVFQDRPQTDWGGGWLSITATIAILSTGAKSAAALAVGAALSQYKWLHFRTAPRKLTDLDLLEEASRGPLGSLTLLAKRPLGLASIGAVVTLLAIGFDVFIQQMVTFEPRDVAMDDGKALLGLSHHYDSGATRVGQRGGVINVARKSFITLDQEKWVVCLMFPRLAASTADLSMYGAAYRGLYNLGSPTVFNCTSKCQWNATYYSLGFTSSCADVTEATLRLHPNASAVWNGTEVYGPQAAMVLTTPGGVKLSARYSATSWQTVVSVAAVSLLKNNTENYSNGVGDTLPPELVRIGVFRAPIDEVDWIFYPAQMQIVECDVALAAYSYSNLSSSGQNLTIGRQEVIRLDPGMTLEAPNATLPNTIAFNQSGLPIMKISASDIAALELFFMSDRFAGNVYEGVSGNTPTPGMGDAFRSGDISKTVQAMVESMTNQLRATYNVTAYGQSINPVVFIQVQWAWITLPLVVEIISIVFFAIILLQSARTAGLPLWKSSTVAVLTYDVRFREDENDVGKLGTGVRSMQELEALAGSWKAKLEVPERK
jgi:hypothetical protein